MKRSTLIMAVLTVCLGVTSLSKAAVRDPGEPIGRPTLSTEKSTPETSAEDHWLLAYFRQRYAAR